MANRMPAVNRWCITGTPIGRSLRDLQGLFRLIREDPYDNQRWFKHFLYDTFKSGDRMPMAKAVSAVLWRTAKKYVEHEINIPKQTEKVFWLDFSSFELHLYQRVLEAFRENKKKCFRSLTVNNKNHNQDLFVSINTANQSEYARVEQFFAQFVDSNVKLDEIDRKTVDEVNIFFFYSLRI